MACDDCCSSGVGIGTVIAIILSWVTNHSILWAILHGIFGWLYVIYWVLCIHAYPP